MFQSRRNRICGMAFFLIFSFISCSRDPEQKSAAESAKQKEKADMQAAPAVMSQNKKYTGGMDIHEGLGNSFLAPFEKSKDRLLEYKVSLTYETRILTESRQMLLAMISKYGYLKGSMSTAENQNPYMTSDIFIKSEQLYDALKDFDNLGRLLNEQITVVDHTENMVLADKKSKREQIRIARKNLSREQISAGSKNWKDVDDSLERSENEFDKDEHEKWKIKDKVAWAEIHIYLKGPEKANDIKIPKYSNAFIGLLNFILKLVYVLIWIIPFIIIFIFLWYNRGRIYSFIKRKK